MSFGFSLMSPERVLFSGSVNEVSLRSEGGEIAFLTGHVPFLGSVRICECRIVPSEGETVLAAVHGGFVEIDVEGGCSLLSHVAELAGEIDVARAREAETRALAELQGEAQIDPDLEEALLRAKIRLAVAGA